MRGLRASDRALAILAGLASAALLAFILLPVLAIFLQVPPGTLVGQMHSTLALEALAVSLRTSLTALAAVLILGTPAAYVLARAKSRWAIALTTILELPLVLPPAVAGIALLVAFGRAGLLGGALRFFGIEIPFTPLAVVMAQAFVAMPFYVRQAIAAFGAVDPQLISASRTLGAGPGRTFARVALPLARSGLSAGAALAWARALGEFGATILFAGSLRGVTQTLPLAIYAQFQTGSLAVPLAISALLVIVSGALLVTVKLLARERPTVAPEIRPAAAVLSVSA